MLSGELARLAGVTVRALRHYHQVGVLDEPARTTNGYRSYDVHDLIRVLRIKQLASLGVPLERMPALLDSTDGDAAGLLAKLDEELTELIERLTKQRDLIARLRAHPESLDLPPELAGFPALLAVPGLPPDVEKMDRDQTVLLAHLAGEGGMPQLVSFYELLSSPELVSAVADFAGRFDKLGPASSNEDISSLIESFITNFGPAIREYTNSERPVYLDGSADLFGEYSSDVINEQQREVLERLEAQFARTEEPHPLKSPRQGL